MDRKHLKAFQATVSARLQHGMFVFRNSGRRERALIPRQSMLDRQASLLSEAHCTLLYRRSYLVKPASFPDAELATVLTQLSRRKPTAKNQRDHKALMFTLTGTSSRPRRIDLVGDAKIFEHTPVEEVVVVKSYALREQQRAIAILPLSEEVLGRGCPTCYCSIDRVIFFTRGLGSAQGKPVRGHCQRCGSYLAIEGATLIEV